MQPSQPILPSRMNRRFPLLGYNGETSLTFQLQKDVDSIMIALKYPDLVEEDNRLVYLQKESAGGCG